MRHLLLLGDRGHRASCRHMRFMCMFHPGVACVSTRCCIYNAMTIHIYCKCIFQMFQLFCMGVVHLDIAYVAVAIRVCCKSTFQMFHLF
jgi:hypothetical protein